RQTTSSTTSRLLLCPLLRPAERVAIEPLVQPEPADHGGRGGAEEEEQREEIGAAGGERRHDRVRRPLARQPDRTGGAERTQELRQVPKTLGADELLRAHHPEKDRDGRRSEHPDQR